MECCKVSEWDIGEVCSDASGKMFLTLPKTPMKGNLPLPQISHENSALTVSPDHEGGRVSMLKTTKGRLESLRSHDKTVELEGRCWGQPSSSHLL